MLPRRLAERLDDLITAVGAAVHAVEVGGSSVQTCLPSSGGQVSFVNGPRPDLDAAFYGLSAPGLVVDGRVFGAHHLGWDGVEAWRELGYSRAPLVSMNDAEASALGEWLLRQDHAAPSADLLYAGIGTGVGGVLISGGTIQAVELGHQAGFGEAVCEGCGRKGCLDAQIGGHALPARLTQQDRRSVAQKLAVAIGRTGVPEGTLVVFAGGLVRSYPELVQALQMYLAPSYPVQPTAAPHTAKSAAYVALLDRLAAV